MATESLITLGLSFEVVNLTEEDGVQVGIAEFNTSGGEEGSTVSTNLTENHPAWSYDGETRFKLGVNLKF